MLYRKWHSEQLNIETVEKLKSSLGISSLLAKVLVNKARFRLRARDEGSFPCFVGILRWREFCGLLETVKRL